MPPRPISLARLREIRVPRSRDQTLARDLDQLAGDLAKRQRAGSGGDRAWETAPDEIRGLGTPAGVSRGVLTIRTADSGSRFLVDRWLRSGGEAQLIRAAKVGIRRVVAK